MKKESEKTKLRLWMDKEGYSTATLSRVLDCSPGKVWHLSDGQITLAMRMVSEIEKLSKGKITLQTLIDDQRTKVKKTSDKKNATKHIEE